MIIFNMLTQVATFPASEDKMEATGEDKESSLEFETGGGDGRDGLRQQALDEATRGFHRFTGLRHPVRHGRVERGFGIAFAQGNPVPADVLQPVLIALIVIGFIARDPRVLGPLKGVGFERRGVAVRAGGQEEFHRLPLGGDPPVDFQTVEGASLAGRIPPPGFARRARATPNPKVIAGR